MCIRDRLSSVRAPILVAVGDTSSVTIQNDGGIEIERYKSDYQGPYIDFKRQGGDFDARIQMDALGGGTALSDGELIFQTPNGTFPLPLNGLNVNEKFRVTRGGAKVTGELEVTGDITALTSDIRLKTDIESIDNALDKVCKISGFTYKHNEAAKVRCNIDTGDQRYVGVSAQDVQQVLPEAVKPAPSNDEYLTVQYEKLVPLLIEAIKELKNEIDELKNNK